MTTTATLTTGDTFTLADARPFTLDGVKGTHAVTHRYRVTEVTERGIAAVYVDTVAEDNRPPFASDPTGVSIAAFAIPLYLANGRMTIDG